MKKQELNRAMILAQSKIDLSNEDISIFDGFGLSTFKKVYCTINQVARLIRWQCFQLNGGIDATNFDELARAGTNKFEIIG